MRERLRKWWPVLKIVLGLVILFFVGKSLWHDLSEPGLWQHSYDMTSLVAAGAFYVAGLACTMLFWGLLLWRAGQFPGALGLLRGYYIGLLGKYAPGKAWALFLRAAFVGKGRVNAAVAVQTGFYEVMMMMAGAGLLACILLAMKAGASDKALAQMQKLLEEDGNWAALYYLLRNERATWHAVWTNTANGDTAMKYSYTDKDHLDYLNFITRAVNWAATAPEKRDRDLAEITTAYAGASEAVRSSLPDVPKIAKAVLNIECRLQAAAAAVQLERARIKDGHWPDSLGAKPPKDAYSGQPFKIVKQPQGRAVYCLFNGGDSAGTFDNLNEKTDAPHNLGFRLLDPDQRR